MQRSLAAMTVLFCAACTAPQPEPPKAVLGDWGVEISNVDSAVKPGDDFFRFVNGKWIDTAAIPAERSSIGSFQILGIESEKRLRKIVNDLQANAADRLTAEERKIVDFYADFTDIKRIEDDGLKPIEADLSRFASLKTKQDVAKAMVAVRTGTDGIFGLFIGIDDKNPNAYSVNLSQSGLGMPDRDYYLSKDEGIVKVREAYGKFLADMLKLAGIGNAEARAAEVYALEAKIAEAHWDRADRRDADKTYNPMSINELKMLTPGFDWDAAFVEVGIPATAPNGERKVIVAEKTAFPVLAEIFRDTPVAVWRDYLTVHYLVAHAAYLPERFDRLCFDFYGKAIRGNDKQLDRPTRAVNLLDDMLGEALGKLYVARYFPPEAKAKARALVDNLLKAYEADIQTLDWMGDATKAKALEKIHAFTPKIGYPDRWRDYSAFEIKRGDLIGNIQRGRLFEWNRNVSRLDRPVDKDEWGMSPATVNAYYNPSFNEIVFPAAILQPPFFDPNADDAVNYGGIGAVIGHEISHGYDDQGSKYDGNGVFQTWWTEEDRKNFDARTAMIVAQYDAYEPIPGMHINGKLTLGENIADLAGLVIAYKAYHIALGGKTPPKRSGFSGDQRFFLGFAQVWRSKYRENAKRNQVLTDPHSAAEFRAIGATRNIDAWYDAFDVKPGDKYYLPPDRRVRLW
jgi:putative endopeptidase